MLWSLAIICVLHFTYFESFSSQNNSIIIPFYNIVIVRRGCVFKIMYIPTNLPDESSNIPGFQK